MGLGIPANTFTGLLLISAIVLRDFISISGLYADKIGRRKWLIWTTVSILIFALCMPLFLGNGTNLRICFLGNWYGINGNDIWPNGGVIA